MTKAKIAVTLDEGLVAAVRRAVKAGRAPSVSAYIEQAVAEWVDNDFDLLLDQMLEESGGPMTDEERAEIDREFGWA